MARLKAISAATSSETEMAAGSEAAARSTQPSPTTRSSLAIYIVAVGPAYFSSSPKAEEARSDGITSRAPRAFARVCGREVGEKEPRKVALDGHGKQ
jgi:hypothetical protein